MNKQSKRKKLQNEKVDIDKIYPFSDAINLLKEFKSSNFDETVDIAIRLGVDTKKAEQMVRGTCSMPNGLGKKIRVLVFAKGEKAIEAEKAGASILQ